MIVSTAIAEAIAELELYADTNEAQAARVLMRLLDLDEITLRPYTDRAHYLTCPYPSAHRRFTS